MGRLGKQLKRKKEVEVKKQVYGIAEKISKAEHKGRMIALSNCQMLDTYLNYYYGSVIATVLHDNFAFGYQKIMKFFELYNEFNEYFTTSAPWRQKVSYFKAGLYRECKGFRIDFKKEMREPKDCNDFAEWCYYYIDHSIKKEVRKIQTMFYWLLHDKFGFGKERLERAKARFQELRGMSLNQFKAVCEGINSLKLPKGEVNMLFPELALKRICELIDPDVPPDEEMAYKVRNIAYRRPAA